MVYTDQGNSFLSSLYPGQELHASMPALGKDVVFMSHNENNTLDRTVHGGLIYFSAQVELCSF